MSLPLYWVDAFTDTVFTGNPAGVVPLERWADDALMQRIAFENGLSETAFFVRTAEDRYHLRWLTPTTEVDLCGHATLAAAFVIFTQLGFAGDVLTFDSRSGPLLVTRLADGRLELDFPVEPAEPAGIPEDLTRALGRVPIAVLRSRTRWLCLYSCATDILALEPDHGLLRKIVPGRITITAPGDDCDFVSRTFVPAVGIPEDPVTGSAHCTLVPYWSGRLGKKRLHARQVSARGGELWCEQAGDRVKIAGYCTLYLKGEIDL
ncbi:MAG TPA: PhzF family phenazine biosynthesis protein [Lacunisphaera sp.]